MIGFIGAGNMAEAIIKGLLKSNKFESNKIIVSDISASRLEFLKNKYNITVTNNNLNVVEKSNTIILAVKPQVIKNVLNEIKEKVSSEKLIISIAAGISINFIESFIGNDKKLIRVMPNACAFALESMSALCFNKNIDERAKQTGLLIFNSIGKTVVLDENYIDAVTAVSGSGPGYIAIILEAFSDAAVNVGLPRDIANKLIIQTVKGTIKLIEQSDKSFIEIKNMVTSPGGTTIKGIHELEKGGIKSSIMNCIEASFKRSTELSG